MAKFKVGDKVRIAKTSSYYGESHRNPKDMDGKVIKNDVSSDHMYRVEWANCVENTYREIDLVSALFQFKVGDLVIMRREPTHDEWIDVGEVPVPNALYEKSHRIVETNIKSNGIRIKSDKDDAWYPSCCFELLPDSPSKKDKLIAEARVRYPKGCYFYSAKSMDRVSSTQEYSYDEGEDMLTDDGWAVYYKGKWAKVDGAFESTYPRFNVGDRVIANSLADDEEYDVTCEGWTGYVYKIKGHEIEVGYTADKKESSDTFWVMAKCFDLQRKAEDCYGPKFEVGDIVRAKNNNGYAITTNGWEGKVIAVGDFSGDGTGKDIKVKGIATYKQDGGEDGFAVNSDRFEIISKGSHILSQTKTSENGKAKQQDDSGRVLKVSHDDFQISRGVTIRGTRINGSTSEVSIGNRHSHHEARPIRG